MISIQFIIPYPELEATVRSLCETYRGEERLTYRISVASRFEGPAEIPPCDAIIARGLAAASLQGGQTPVISIRVSAFDVLRAIHACIQKYHLDLYREKKCHQQTKLAKYHYPPVHSQEVTGPGGIKRKSLVVLARGSL